VIDVRKRLEEKTGMTETIRVDDLVAQLAERVRDASDDDRDLAIVEAQTMLIAVRYAARMLRRGTVIVDSDRDDNELLGAIAAGRRAN